MRGLKGREVGGGGGGRGKIGGGKRGAASEGSQIILSIYINYHYYFHLAKDGGQTPSPQLNSPCLH